MTGLKVAVRMLCLLAVVTGSIDMVAGVRLLIAGGGHLGGVAADPVLNSQVGFWGAIWFGFGIVLWHASSRLRSDVRLFRILCATTALSGLARLGAAIVYGLPGSALTVAMIVEVGAGVGFFFWHLAALQGDRAFTHRGSSRATATP